jgi:hypothetical protein
MVMPSWSSSWRAAATVAESADMAISDQLAVQPGKLPGDRASGVDYEQAVTDKGCQEHGLTGLDGAHRAGGDWNRDAAAGPDLVPPGAGCRNHDRAVRDVHVDALAGSLGQGVQQRRGSDAPGSVGMAGGGQNRSVVRAVRRCRCGQRK